MRAFPPPLVSPVPHLPHDRLRKTREHLPCSTNTNVSSCVSSTPLPFTGPIPLRSFFSLSIGSGPPPSRSLSQFPSISFGWIRSIARATFRLFVVRSPLARTRARRTASSYVARVFLSICIRALQGRWITKTIVEAVSTRRQEASSADDVDVRVQATHETHPQHVKAMPPCPKGM